MDGLNEAIRSARGGWPRGRKLFEKAMSEELGNSPAPAAELAEAVELRLRAIEDVRRLGGDRPEEPAPSATPSAPSGSSTGSASVASRPLQVRQASSARRRAGPLAHHAADAFQ